MARGRILTEKDQAKYLAGLEKPVPAETQPEAKKPVELTALEVEAPEVPLGDIARAAHQQELRGAEIRVQAGYPYLPYLADVGNRTLQTAERSGYFVIPSEARNLSSLGPQEKRDSSRHRASRFTANVHHKWNHKNLSFSAASFAASRMNTSNSIHSPPKIAPYVGLRRQRHAKHRPDGLENTGFETVTVRPGDSLWKLARHHLGRGRRWRALLTANPWISSPNHLRIGSQIRV
jgi:nucleoid-associated protein YgaU